MYINIFIESHPINEVETTVQTLIIKWINLGNRHCLRYEYSMKKNPFI